MAAEGIHLIESFGLVRIRDIDGGADMEYYFPTDGILLSPSALVLVSTGLCSYMSSSNCLNGWSFHSCRICSFEHHQLTYFCRGSEL